MDRKNIKTNPLLESYREHIERIDKALEAELNLYVESEFTEPLKYAIADGKRIRPIILALAAESKGRMQMKTYTQQHVLWSFCIQNR